MDIFPQPSRRSISNRDFLSSHIRESHPPIPSPIARHLTPDHPRRRPRDHRPRPPAHGVCEIGWQDVALGEDGRWELYGEGGSLLVNPGRPIPPVTQAIHHILDEHVADAPFWHDVARRVLDPWPRRLALAAHRADFEQQFCTPDADPRRGVDLHLEMRAAAVARLAELLQPGAALLAQARTASTTNAACPHTARSPTPMSPRSTCATSSTRRASRN